MFRWKRKRHSGGSGRVRGLELSPGEPDDMFCFDMDDMEEIGDQSVSEDDASFETDDSGNGGEEVFAELYMKETITTSCPEVDEMTPTWKLQLKTSEDMELLSGSFANMKPIQIPPMKIDNGVQRVFQFNRSTNVEENRKNTECGTTKHSKSLQSRFGLGLWHLRELKTFDFQTTI